MTAEQREQEAKAFAKRMVEEALRLRDKERELMKAGGKQNGT